MFFIQRLGRIQHLLGIEAKALGAIDLQRRQVIGQRHSLLAGLAFILGDHTWLAGNALHHIFGQRL